MVAVLAVTNMLSEGGGIMDIKRCGERASHKKLAMAGVEQLTHLQHFLSKACLGSFIGCIECWNSLVTNVAKLDLDIDSKVYLWI